MSWDGDVPKLGDMISLIPSGGPLANLRQIAEVIERQAEEFYASSRHHQEEAVRKEVQATALKNQARSYRAAIARLEGAEEQAGMR